MSDARKLGVSKIVLDSSAVLAVVYAERGAAKVVELLESGEIEPMISAVNLCEVQTRLLRDGLSVDQAIRIVSDFELTIVPFGVVEARSASALYLETKALGLSLGDRACLALALRDGLAVWTADSVWKKLKLEVEIELIRI